jgi:hypothetical protein
MRRRHYGWLVVLAAMIGIAVLSSAVPAQVTFALLALYAVAVGATFLNFKPEKLLDRSRSSLTMMRMSSEAREAVERARRRGSLLDSSLTLLDIGLITSQSSREGMVMHRTRTVSKDDDGVRPFVTLHVQPESAEQTALLRFEMIDHNGQSQYIHEMRTYLRDGEMNILADHHLPLTGNEQIAGAGDWDLRVSLNGTLIGAHAFNLTPSINERLGRYEQPAAVDSARPRLRQNEDDAPMSLEELLRSESARSRENRSQ